MDSNQVTFDNPMNRSKGNIYMKGGCREEGATAKFLPNKGKRWLGI